MPTHCPHCHAALEASSTGAPPTRCPQCGGLLPSTGASLASFLRRAPAAAPDTAEAPETAGTVDAPTEAHAPGTAAQVPVESVMDAPPAASDAADTAPAEIDHTPHADADAARHVESHFDAEAAARRADALPPPASATAQIATTDAAAATPGPLPAPSFLAAKREAARPVPAWQWLALGGLALLLVLQLLVAQRQWLAADAQWRPWITRLCALAGCDVPPWHEPAAFRMLGRDIRAVPGQPGALQLRATFRNDARWPQPLPRLRVSLSDADGHVLGVRTLSPAEYLPRGTLLAPLAPGQSVQAEALLREPATPAAAFAFEFR